MGDKRDTSLLSAMRVSIIIMVNYIYENRYFILKNLAISAVIISYILLLHYPRLVMYSLIVAPLENSETEYAIQVLASVERATDAIKAVHSVADKCGLEEYGVTVEVHDEERGMVILLVDRVESMHLVLAHPVVGRLPLNGKEVAVVAANTLGLGKGDEIKLGGYRFDVVGEVFINPIHSPVFQRITVDGIIGVNEGDMARFVESLEPSDRGYFAVLLAKNVEDGVDMCLESLKVDGRFSVLEVFNISEVLQHDKEVYRESYGESSVWSTDSLAASVILVLYMVKVAISDVSDKMRESVALVYSMGAGDIVVALMLMLKFGAIGLLSIITGFIGAGIYMEKALETPLSMATLITNLSWVAVTALIAGALASAVAGVYGARRARLVEVLNGA